VFRAVNSMNAGVALGRSAGPGVDEFTLRREEEALGQRLSWHWSADRQGDLAVLAEGSGGVLEAVVGTKGDAVQASA
jgi:hypothetical protein